MIQNTKITLDAKLTDSNLGVLLANVQRLEEEKPEEPAAEKAVQIDLLVLENTTVAVNLPQLRQSVPDIHLGRIEMRDIGRKEDTVTIAEAIGQVLEEILKSVMQSGVDLPGNMMDILEDTLKGVPLEGARDILEGATRGLNDTLRGLGGRERE